MFSCGRPLNLIGQMPHCNNLTHNTLRSWDLPDPPHTSMPHYARSPSSELLADTAAILSLAQSHGLNDVETPLVSCVCVEY